MKAPEATTKEYSRSDRVAAATLQTSLETGADPFTGRSDMFSHAAQKEPHGRKRKEMEAEIQVDELMSIMSEDMNCFEEHPCYNKQAQITVQSSAGQKQRLNTDEVSSLSKRQRVHKGESGTSQKPQVSPKKDSRTCEDLKPNPERRLVSIKEEQVHLPEYGTTNSHFTTRPAERSSASKSQVLEPFEEDNEPSFIEVSIEDLRLVNTSLLLF